MEHVDRLLEDGFLMDNDERFPSAAENIHRPAEDILNFSFRNCNQPARGRGTAQIRGDFIL